MFAAGLRGDVVRLGRGQRPERFSTSRALTLYRG